MEKLEDFWQDRLKEIAGRSLDCRCFSGFNANIDAVVHLEGSVLQGLLAGSGVTGQEVESRSILDMPVVEDLADLFAVLKDRIAKGKAFHITVESPEVLHWLETVFPDPAEEMGGQAGIIANQMAALGARSIVYTPLMSPRLAKLFHPEVLSPTVSPGGLRLEKSKKAARRDRPVKINWILEYAEGDVFHFGSVEVRSPRANRVILATRPRGAVMGFEEELVPYLPDLAGQADVAFLAGYHSAGPVLADGRTFKQYLGDSLFHLQQLRAGNPELRLHFEYVPMKSEELEIAALEGISRAAKSLGINENEIKRVLKEFGFEEDYTAILQREGAETLYRGARRLLDHFDLERVQVHNLGYYVLLLRRPYPVDPERVVLACLFASCVSAARAQFGGHAGATRVREAAEIRLSPLGFQQMRAFASELAPGQAAHLLKTGVAEYGDHYVVLVPAHVVKDPVSTVGIGDTISSASFAMEASGLSVAPARA